MKRVAQTLAPLVLLLVLLGCRGVSPFSGGDESSASMQELVNLLRNSDVRWDGTYVGVQPTVLGQNAQRILKMGTNAVPFLLCSLTNRDQYVVAHVLLTKITLSPFSSDSSHWNLLPVKLMSNGRISYGENAQSVVCDYWGLTGKP